MRSALCPEEQVEAEEGEAEAGVGSGVPSCLKRMSRASSKAVNLSRKAGTSRWHFPELRNGVQREMKD